MERKKLTVNKLAFGNLKARRKQYTLMIIGIILAMTFSSGTIFFFACCSNSVQELVYKTVGRENAVMYGGNDINLDEAVELGYLEDYATAEIIGYGYSPDGEKESGTALAYYDKKAMYLANSILESGEFPQKEGEIAIEKDALVRLKRDGINVGDSLDMTVIVPNGDKGEVREVNKTYTVCGILEDKRANVQRYVGDESEFYLFPAAMVSSEERTEAGGLPCKFRYLSIISDDNSGYNADFIGWLSDLNFYNGNAETSSNYMHQVEDYMSYASGFYDIITTNTYLVAFLMAVLMIASCFGIINAFNTNLQDRKKQIGLLRAVGMTKRQIINVFGREAFIISIISAPVSILISYFGVKLYAEIMGEGFIFKPEWSVLIISTVASVVSVMIAALIPLLSATRINPMQAIRNSELGRKVKNKKIKSKKVFNAPNLIAKRSITFYRSRQIGIVFLLIVISVFPCIGFCVLGEYSAVSQNMLSYPDYTFDDYNYASNDYAYFPAEQTMDEDFRNTIYDSEHVGNIKGTKTVKANLFIDEFDKYTELVHTYQTLETSIESDVAHDIVKDADSFKKYGARTEPDEGYLFAKEKTNCPNELLPTAVKSYDEADIAKLESRLISGKIDIDKLNSGEEIILVAYPEIAYTLHWQTTKGERHLSWDGVEPLDNGELIQQHTNFETEILEKAKLGFEVGDTVDFRILINGDKPDGPNDSYSEKYVYDLFGKEFTIGAIVTPQNYYSDTIIFATTHSGLSSFGCGVKYDSLSVDLNKECTQEVDEEMQLFFTSMTSGKSAKFQSNYADLQSRKSEMKFLLTAILAVIILFLCIGASIINNAVTAKIGSDRREIGTLRAVGASAKELSMAFIHQLVSMFVWGCSIGLATYIIGYTAFKHYYVFIKGYPFEFTFEIWQSIIICFVLFVFCCINVYVKIKKQMKYSIVENIREL